MNIVEIASKFYEYGTNLDLEDGTVVNNNLEVLLLATTIVEVMNRLGENDSILTNEEMKENFGNELIEVGKELKNICTNIHNFNEKVADIVKRYNLKEATDYKED